MTAALARPAPVAADPGERSAQWVALTGDYMFDRANPLADFSLPHATAYPARSEKFPTRALLVYFADSHPGPRITEAQKIVGLQISGLMALVAYFMTTGPTGEPSAAFVYERPWRRLRRTEWGIKSTLLDRIFVKPIAGTLVALANAGHFHGEINPSNLFWTKGMGELVLGPSLLGPPGFSQPPIFDDPYRGLCMPEGKGRGTTPEDLYSAGLTLYAVSSGRVPGDEQPVVEDLRRRLSHGTVASAINLAKVTSVYTPVLSGLLDDNLQTRWTAEQFFGWTNGRRPEVAPSRKTIRPVAPIAIGKRSAYTPRELALIAFSDRSEAADALINGSIGLWLQQVLDNDIPVPRLSAKSGTETEVSVCKLTLTLDPRMPIRFKSLTFMANAIGSILLLGARRPEVRDELIELVAAGIPAHWLALNASFARGEAEFENFGNLPQLIGPGGEAYERALYQVNPDAPCLSPRAFGMMAVSPSEILAIAEKSLGDLTAPPDPHLQGFVTARAGLNSRDIDVLTGRSGDPDTSLKSIDAFARVQDRAEGRPMPKIAERLSHAAGLVVAVFRNPGRRGRVAADVQSAIEAGDVRRLHRILSDKTAHVADETEFRAARSLYLAQSARLNNSDPVSRERRYKARMLAASFAALVNGILMLGGAGFSGYALYLMGLIR